MKRRKMKIAEIETHGNTVLGKLSVSTPPNKV